MYKVSNMLWGLVLIIIGVVLGLNALNITNIEIFFDGWWTLFIIIPCFIDLFKNQDRTGCIIGLVIGISLLLGCQDVVDFELLWKLLIPVILVIIGLSVIFKDAINGKVKKEIKKLNKGTQKEYSATFGGQTIDFSKEEFKGCDMNAVFGGIKCNLKDAIIKSDVVINVSAIFGGATIIVPEDVNVKISSIQIFGGVSDERKNKVKDAKHTIYVNATSMFGGVEVK